VGPEVLEDAANRSESLDSSNKESTFSLVREAKRKRERKAIIMAGKDRGSFDAPQERSTRHRNNAKKSGKGKGVSAKGLQEAHNGPRHEGQRERKSTTYEKEKLSERRDKRLAESQENPSLKEEKELRK